MAKCKYRNAKLSLYQQGQECQKKFGPCSSPCPDNADSDCTLIPKTRPKRKMARINMELRVHNEKIIGFCYQDLSGIWVNLKPVKYGKLKSINVYGYLDAKYLEGRKE